MSTFKQLVGIIERISEAPPDHVTVETRIDALALDSLDLLELQMEIDDTFDAHLELDAFLRCETLGDLLALLKD